MQFSSESVSLGQSGEVDQCPFSSRVEVPVAVGVWVPSHSEQVPMQCGRQRAIAWPSCNKLSKCWGHFRNRGGRVAICLGEGKEIVFGAHGGGADHGVQGVYRLGREACGRFGRSAKLRRLLLWKKDELGCNVLRQKYRARVTLCCHHRKILCPR